MTIKQHKQRYYLDLVEYDATGTVIAKAKAIIRSGELLDHYVQKLGYAGYHELQWKHITFSWVCRFHALWWLSITIERLSAEVALWVLVKHKEQLRARLLELGIYENNRSLSWGLPPYRIAVISSATSEWYRDFVTILADSAYRFEIELYPSAVHGSSAADDIVTQVHAIQHSEHPYALIVITRWGGGGEWLARQHDTRLIEEVCTSSLPILLATGHTSDVSLLDEVVWKSAKTPSDAAYLLIAETERNFQLVETTYHLIHTQIAEQIDRYAEQVDQLSTAIRVAGTRLIDHYETTLQQRWDLIESMDPLHVLQKWYALLQTTDHSYIGTRCLQQIALWETLLVQTASSTLTVRIEHIETVPPWS